MRYLPLKTLLALCLFFAPARLALAQAGPEGTLRQLLALPAPTPRNAQTAENGGAVKERPDDFYADANVPRDDAPLADLIDYWPRRAGSEDGPKPSDAVKRRLLAAAEADPKKLTELLWFLPEGEETAARVKKLYDDALVREGFEEDWRSTVREWLRLNSSYFLEELLAQAHKAKDKDGSVENEEALGALARVDPEAAMPLLQSLANGSQPRSAALALSLLYKNALATKDTSAEEMYRVRLRVIASDVTALAYARDNAIKALSQADWPGRDDWYLSLFEDETLANLVENDFRYSPLNTLFTSDPDKWIPVMARLVEGRSQALRETAASCLMAFQNEKARKDAALPLLPWLSNPAWLNDEQGNRLTLIQSLSSADVPESVPGLIWVVEHDEDANRRSFAAESLARYRDPRAAPALRKALTDEKDQEHRGRIIKGLVASGGISEGEQLDALVAYAERLTTAEGREDVERYRTDEDEPLSVKLSIGKYLVGQENVPDTLAAAVLIRAEALRKTRPALTRAMIEIAEGWQGGKVDSDMVRRIGAGTADADTINKALGRREKLRKSAGAHLQGLAGGEGAARGIAVVLLEDEALALGMLGSDDAQSLAALLACARLVQMPLPPGQVGLLLDSKDALLAQAAEQYLLAEDSREARALLWARHEGEAFVTGWRDYSDSVAASDIDGMARVEERLRAELFKKEGAPLQLFALLEGGEYPARVLRVYPDRAVYTFYEDESRSRERVVTPEEFREFKGFIAGSNIEESGPQINYCHYDCWASEFFTVSKPGGRRVFSYQSADAWATMTSNFDLLGRGGKARYRLESDIKGVEVLYDGEGLAAKDVWQKGDDLRVLFEREETPVEVSEEQNLSGGEVEESEEAQKAARLRGERAEALRARARLSWRVFTNGMPGAASARPEGYSAFDELAYEVDTEEFNEALNGLMTEALSDGSLILAGGSEGAEGLWKKSVGRKPVRVSGEGKYSGPLVTPDGRWVVASRTDNNWEALNYMVRLDLRTGKEYRVSIPPADMPNVVAYVPSHGKVLVQRVQNEGSLSKATVPEASEFYLLDAATGEAKPVTGVFTPLEQRGKRGLQPTGRPSEFWAAIPDTEKNSTRVGRYNTRDFSFQTLLTVPHLTFDSMSAWVEEAGARLYVVYKGQLIRIPMGKQ